MPLQTLPSNEQGKNISSVFLKKKKKITFIPLILLNGRWNEE